MPFNGLGTFSRVYSWVTDASNNLNVDATRMDTDTNDIAAGLSLCITKDGQQTVTANIPMNSHKFTGLSAGSVNGDSIRWEQISAIATWALTPSSANLLAAMTDKTGTGLNVFNTSPAFAGTPTVTGGLLQIYDTTQNRFGGLVTLAAGKLIGIGMNDSSSNTFGGAYTSADQGGAFYTDTRAGQPLFSWLGRPAASTAAATALLLLTSGGQLYGSALHNNAGAVTGTTNQYIASGTYTPTLTNVANCTSTAFACQWIRVGNVVTVSGQVAIAPTALNTLTDLGISLPIASTLAAAEQLGGTAVSWLGATGAANNTPAQIKADAVNHRADLSFSSNSLTTSSNYSFTFTYVVL